MGEYDDKDEHGREAGEVGQRGSWWRVVGRDYDRYKMPGKNR